jgi:hypothetical protein
MDINLAERSRARIDKGVWAAGWHNHDVAGSRFNCRLANGKRDMAFLNDKDFFVGMAMQLWPTSWWRVN